MDSKRSRQVAFEWKASWKIINKLHIKKRNCFLTHWAGLGDEGSNVPEGRQVNKKVAVLGLWWTGFVSNINSMKKTPKHNLQLISGADPPQAFSVTRKQPMFSEDTSMSATAGIIRFYCHCVIVTVAVIRCNSLQQVGVVVTFFLFNVYVRSRIQYCILKGLFCLW